MPCRLNVPHLSSTPGVRCGRLFGLKIGFFIVPNVGKREHLAQDMPKTFHVELTTCVSRGTFQLYYVVEGLTLSTPLELELSQSRSDSS